MRISKKQYYLNIAERVSYRSTCLKIQFGAIIVNDEGVILASGYNGAPRGSFNCNEEGFCIKEKLGAKSAEYDLCPAVHAEENCVINAARSGTSIKGGTLYFCAPRTGFLYHIEGKVEVEEQKKLMIRWFAYGPCPRCRRILINAGIKKVISPAGSWSHRDLIKLDRKWFDDLKERVEEKGEEQVS